MSPWDWLIWVVVGLCTFMALLFAWAATEAIITQVQQARKDRKATNREMEIQDDDDK